MTPHEWTKYREAFDRAATILGWKCVEVTENHERDWDCSWETRVWLSAKGERIADESDMSEGFVKEIIQIADERNLFLRVMRTTAFDNCDDIWRRTDNEYAPLSIFVNCSDLFDWGCADCEKITPENIDEFEKAYADVEAAGDRLRMHASALFCCRVRKCRPQGAAYPSIVVGEGDEDDLRRKLWDLFDACGPKREVGMGNPHLHPADRKEKKE